MCFNLFMYFLKNDMQKLSLHHMLIVFDSKSSLTHYTFDQIKFLSQLHICIVLLNILFLKIYVQKLTCCSCKLGFRGSFLVSGNCENAGFCTIYPRASGDLKRPQTPLRNATFMRWGRVVTLHRTLKQI